NAFGDYAVIGDHARKHRCGWRWAEWLGERRAIAIEREVVNGDVFARGQYKQRASAEGVGGLDRGVGAVDLQVMGVGWEGDFARNFDNACRQRDCAGFGLEGGAEPGLRRWLGEKRERRENENDERLH